MWRHFLRTACSIEIPGEDNSVLRVFEHERVALERIGPGKIGPTGEAFPRMPEMVV